MKEERAKKENPFKENESEGTYLAEGLSIGMCLGIALGQLLFDNVATGLSIGMCLGLAIGMSIKKGNKKEE